MSDSAGQLVEHFFRHESAKLIAVLTRAFGFQRLDLIEDAVQAAMMEAMQAWSAQGVPANPAAWIHRAAKNRVFDALRRDATYQHALTVIGHSTDDQTELVDQWLGEEQIPDSLLRMMFVCCHQALDRKTQIALTLKVMCGFSLEEIGRAVFLSRETVKKRIQRAKRVLVEAQVQIQLPEPDQLIKRLDVVHDVLYLLFNEGYSTSDRVEPIRDDVCEEAVRLCYLLCQSPLATAASKALLALMLFQASRLDSRIDEAGVAVLLEDQDRTRWDQRLISMGQCWLAQSKTDCPTVLHLEAAIAMQHCVAPSVEKTDWKLIATLYGRIQEQTNSPLYALNKAIAIGQSGDLSNALEQLHALEIKPGLANYHLLDCAIARVLEQQGDQEAAVSYYRQALTKNPAPHERELIERRLKQLGV